MYWLQFNMCSHDSITKKIILLLEMHSCNEHEKNAKMGHFQFSFSYHGKYSVGKFERKSIVTFISEELP